MCMYVCVCVCVWGGGGVGSGGYFYVVVLMLFFEFRAKLAKQTEFGRMFSSTTFLTRIFSHSVLKYKPVYQ